MYLLGGCVLLDIGLGGNIYDLELMAQQDTMPLYCTEDL